MFKAIVPVLAGLGLLAIAGSAFAQGDGGCSWQRTANTQATEAPATQPAPTMTDGRAG